MRLTIFLCVAVLAFAGADTVTSRISSALETDVITPDEAALYYMYSVYDTGMIPLELTENAVTDPCGTHAMDMIVSLLDDCTASTRDGILDILARPDVGSPEYLYDSAEGYFKIHWTDNGANATTEANAILIANAMDWSWIHQCNDMDWDEPPSDLGLGGDEKYDVYIMQLDPGTIGYCSTSGEVPDPMTPEADYSSHICISNANWGDNQINETCSHEFQHALQAGYEAAEPTWFKENCSTWMQNECWDTNLYADYMHGGENCLRKTWYDIRSGAMYWYGCTPWPMYMQVRCGGQATVRRVWEECAAVVGVNMLDALNTAAEAYGMTFNQWLAEYTAWRWFTGVLADGEHYVLEESSLWTPGAYVFTCNRITSLPASGDEISTTYAPKTFGHHYIKVDVAPYQGWIEFEFDGRDNFEWHVGIIQTASDGTDAFEYHTVNNSSATLSVGVETIGWDEVIFFVQPITITTLSMTFDYSIEYLTGIEEEENPADPMSISPASNPLWNGGEFLINLPQAGFTTVNIYDLSGRMIQNVHAGNLQQGCSNVIWNAENLSAGTYFVRMTAPGGAVTNRVALIK